jgi:hypothetical protein
MALREEQIQRYGRQILLREVGGKGQERLLHFPVRVDGRSSAIDVAVSVLAAGGTPLHCVQPPGDGFLAGASLDDFNPDARASEPAQASLAPAGVSGPPLPYRVVVCAQGLVSVNGHQVCPDCLAATTSALEGPADSVDDVLLGGLAALLLQRIALGLSLAEGVLHPFRVSDGALHAVAPTLCPRHMPGM